MLRQHFSAIAGLLLTAWLVSAAINTPPFQPRLPDAALWPQGRYVYQRNCLTCHGTYGDGRGELGRTLKPPPRHFGRGVFKYRSTPGDALPTDADLQWTIRNGLVGTAMPVFSNLSDREVRSVIEYLKSFSSRWQNPTNYAPALVLPSPPVWWDDTLRLNARIENGRSLFHVACAPCHGSDGSGKDALARDLEDAWGQPATPTNLRLPMLRSGRNLEAAYRVLLTGIEGTPMPSFAESLSEEQRWELVAFIGQLRRDEAVAGR